MKYSTKTGSLNDLVTPCLVTTLANAKKLASQWKAGPALSVATKDFDDKAGSVLLVNMPDSAKASRILVCGSDGTVSVADFNKIVNAAAARLATLKITSAALALNTITVTDRDVYWKICTTLTAISLSVYGFNNYKSSAQSATLRTVHAVVDNRSRSACQKAVREANALKQGFDFARDLGNQPPNVCNPTYLLREARKLGKSAKVKVSALDEKKMESLGMGAFMSVTRGSTTPGKMIIVEYSGGKKTDAPVVLIGKGITFDTGGISLKPGAAMDEMKFDMCGAAAVLGTTVAAIEASLPINLICIVAAAENMPAGNASRPGDIVATMSGKTVEILNTDAEGRLVLCDALTYAERYKPKTVIDVATLTGAVIVALGSHASAVFSNDQTLARDLIDAGEISGDRAWQLPVWEEYGQGLSSNFADMANIGGRDGGSSVAAAFLARFTDKFTWAHMDIAGTAFRSGPRKGSTGRPVGLLFRYLLDHG
ncbi:MAG: leucyl aminopeptidase [Proteobacteria bacterium]|nr:leucyl aminopeptidase [Pseudomonadota bacterium]